MKKSTHKLSIYVQLRDCYIALKNALLIDKQHKESFRRMRGDKRNVHKDGKTYQKFIICFHLKTN
jgi:hypothetical protein